MMAAVFLCGTCAGRLSARTFTEHLMAMARTIPKLLRIHVPGKYTLRLINLVCNCVSARQELVEEQAELFCQTYAWGGP